MHDRWPMRYPPARRDLSPPRPSNETILATQVRTSSGATFVGILPAFPAAVAVMAPARVVPKPSDYAVPSQIQGLVAGELYRLLLCCADRDEPCPPRRSQLLLTGCEQGDARSLGQAWSKLHRMGLIEHSGEVVRIVATGQVLAFEKVMA